MTGTIGAPTILMLNVGTDIAHLHLTTAATTDSLGIQQKWAPATLVQILPGRIQTTASCTISAMMAV